MAIKPRSYWNKGTLLLKQAYRVIETDPFDECLSKPENQDSDAIGPHRQTLKNESDRIRRTHVKQDSALQIAHDADVFIHFFTF